MRLEDVARAVSARLVRIETRLDATASKAELADAAGGIRAELHKAINEQTWKLITWTTGLGAALVGAAYFIARSAH